MDLVCPKCQGAMRTYERNGVHVDQCTECRGIFLDRGELERLVDAETAWHGGGAAAQPAGQQHGSAHGQPSGQPYAQPAYGQHAAGAQYPAAGGAGLGAVVNEVLGAVRGGQSSHGSSHGSSYGHRKRKESFLSDLFG
ncbi:Zn-finger nucleic acid-binding protein [Geodermatophilus bullaregiensis]|uniref:TFIIB-type zinc ribbon-containing protein n=1 Tax=Geodermatophilus bullaregiensis TaxID=1564160 RepID=UPI00195CEE44|nr:zf-TFIIB domain-containing protein [Geodermatophilus bullaregiensis]MBM7808782.1 Zn-finger nucleic acid-binding protein [Geodermatophilus bullaregiensis]